MNTKRVLLITYHFPPSSAVGGLRLLGFTRHLPGCGWGADVVAPPVCVYEQADAGLLRLVPEETRRFDIPFPDTRMTRMLVMTIGFSAWLPMAMPTCRRLVKSGAYDAVLTSGPPHCVHEIGLDLKRRYGIPWAADFRDTWTGMEQGPFTTSVRILGDRIVARRERSTILAADAVIANTPGGAEAFRAEFAEAADRVDCVTNGYDPEDFEAVPLKAQGSTPGVIDILHSGNIYAGRDPRPVIAALAGLNAEAASIPGRPRFRIHFVGHVDGFDLAAEAERAGLDRSAITIRGRVSHDQIVREMKGADILLLLDSPGRRIGVPAKLYEYLGAARPVLALSEPGNDVGRIAGDCGLPARVAPLADDKEIRRALLELADLSEKSLPSPSGRYTRASLSMDLAGILDRISAGKTRRRSGREVLVGPGRPSNPAPGR
jgi:glycosyltransferase involved in cell wall biosynthesis